METASTVSLGLPKGLDELRGPGRRWHSPLATWLVERAHRRFAESCTRHLVSRPLRERLRSEILRTIHAEEAAGRSMRLDARLPVRVNEHDLESGRINIILNRLNGIRYTDENIFVPGLERRLMLSHQRAGIPFRWTRLPAHAPVSIQFIDTTLGFGVFAERDLTEGEYVGEYTGLVTPEGDPTVYTYLHAYYPLSERDEEVSLVIDSQTMGNATRFVNHSISPNVLHRSDYFFNGHWHVLYMVAADVAKGDQMLIDYGEGYWKGQDLTPLTIVP